MTKSCLRHTQSNMHKCVFCMNHRMRLPALRALHCCIDNIDIVKTIFTQLVQDKSSMFLCYLHTQEDFFERDCNTFTCTVKQLKNDIALQEHIIETTAPAHIDKVHVYKYFHVSTLIALLMSSNLVEKMHKFTMKKYVKNGKNLRLKTLSSKYSKEDLLFCADLYNLVVKPHIDVSNCFFSFFNNTWFVDNTAYNNFHPQFPESIAQHYKSPCAFFADNKQDKTLIITKNESYEIVVNGKIYEVLEFEE